MRAPPRRSLFLDVLFHRWPWRALITLCSLLGSIAGLAAPWFQKEFIDMLTGARSPVHLGWFESASPWVACAFAATLASQAFSQLTNYLGSREAIFLQRRFAERLYDRMLALRAETMSRRPLGEVVSLYATDVPGATIFLEQTLPMGAGTLFPLILAPFALSAFFETPLWLTVSLIVFITMVNMALAFRQSRFFYRFKQLAAERIGLVNEWVQNIRTLRILGWTTAFERAIFDKREIETDNRVGMVTNGQTMNAISTSITFALNIATLASLALWNGRTLTPGETLALLWIVGVFLTRPFRQMPWFFTFIFDAWTSLQRLQDFLRIENKPMPITKDLASPSAQPNAALEIRGLHLQIGSRTLLDQVDLVVRDGEFVAIVGEVGSGKSLLLLSLLRETGASFLRYQIGGADVLKWPEGEVRSKFGFVPQEGFIMSATLRDNVAFDYDQPTAIDGKVSEALKLADFDPSRERVDRGLDAEIGERGVNLSGGQRQRVSIARAHFAAPEILLLDDCLSAVDVDTEERLVARLLDGAWRGRTRLLVTHRLTVLDKVDRIIFLKDGRVLAEGRLDELIAKSPEFREFTLSIRRQNEEVSTPLSMKAPPPAEPAVPPLPGEESSDA